MAEPVSFLRPTDVSSPPNNATLVKATNATDTDTLWDQFNKFYNNNEQAIEQCMKTDVRSIALGEKVSDIEQQIDAFSETTKVVLDGLAGLGKMHPIIGAAVVGFHAVISLDVSRRDNNRKVIVIMLEMRNMMCALFQLRHLKHTHVQQSEMEADKRGFHQLIESITKDIYQCGSDLNYYLDQNFAFKLIKAKNFEQRFTTHIENFARRRAQLQSTLTVYIAGGIDRANDTISAISMKLNTVDAKLDDLVGVLLRKLDTPQEREVFRFFEHNNGVENCISKDNLLRRLLTMTGGVLPDSENKAGLTPDERVKKSRKVLTDEVHQNFEEALKQNTLRFERLLTVQNNNHERVIAQLEMQEGYHKETMSKLDKMLYYMHPDTKLTDPEVRRIWKRMGLKTSVKAKTFVLTFRDYYQHDHSTPPTPKTIPTPSPSLFAIGTSGAPSHPLSADIDHPDPASPLNDPNEWMLEYIDVVHVRPIVEAIDADGSGFISVKEINTFALARPKEWSLLPWMAYWAAGWHINITRYQNKIYDILIQMHELLPLLHPANRVFVDEYLDSYSMATVEGILRCTKSVTDFNQRNPIAALAQFYADAQESALRTNLKEICYVISSVSDAKLVVGHARAESWIYPLLYLLLERHLAVVKLGRTTVYNPLEIYTHWVSLDHVLAVFKQRKESLTAIFSQIHPNTADRFETFAYGMFYASYKQATEIIPTKNTLIKMRKKRSTRELLLETLNRSPELAAPPDVLALEKGTPFEFEDLNIYESATAKTNSNTVSHPLEGYWSVTCLYSGIEFCSDLGLLHFFLSITPDGSITGSGEAYVGKLRLMGTASLFDDQSSTHSLKLKMVVKNVAHNMEVDYFFHGMYNSERDTVTGSWEQVNSPQKTSLEVSAKETTGAVQEGHSNSIVQGTELGQDFLAPQNAITDPIRAHDNIIFKVAQTPQTSDRTFSGETDETCRSDSMNFENDSNSCFSEPAQDLEAASDVVEDAAGAEDADLTEKERPLAPNTFSMRRTPADVHRFRRDLNPESEPDSCVLANNRWKFAIEATMFRVRIKNFSWEYVRARFTERRLWLDLTIAFWQNPLPKDRFHLMCTLTEVYAPWQSRLYEALAIYLHPKDYRFKSGLDVWCDYCGNEIVCNRYRCITCTKDDMSDQIDLCTETPDCIENASSNSRLNFVHTPSHTLLRSTFWLHKIHYSSFLTRCRTRSENVKQIFRTLGEIEKIEKKPAKTPNSGKSEHNLQTKKGVNVRPLHCICCENEVSLPCWICATCATNTAICLECELKRAKIVKYDNWVTMHSHDHYLLRISDSTKVLSVDVDNVRLHRELINITTDLKTLEKKFTTHLLVASKVNTLLRGSKSDGEVIRASTNHNTNSTPMVNGEAEAAVTAVLPDTVTEGEDDNISDIFESIRSAPEPEPESPAPTSESRQFADHLMSIDTRISSLETHISSLRAHTDARISGLDNRLSGVESQLGQILSLLRKLPIAVVSDNLYSQT